jgi:chromosome segregation ATPase
MSETRNVGFFKRLADDYSASRDYLNARRKIGTIGAQREAAQKELESARHALGARAAELGLPMDLPAAAAAAQQKQDLAGAEGLLRDRESALRSAEETLSAESDKHKSIILSLQDEHRSLVDGVRAAKSDLDQIWQRISGLESQIHASESAIATAAEGKPTPEPIDALHQKITDAIAARRTAEAELADPQSKHAQIATIAAGKAAELAAAQQVWRDVETTCNANVNAARTARDEAAANVKSSTAAMKTAEKSLGDAIAASALRPPEIEAEQSKAQSAATKLAEVESERTALESQIAATKGPAGRFALMAGIGALLVIAIIVLIIALATASGGKKPAGSAEEPGSAPSTAPATTAPATTTPAIPASMPATAPALNSTTAPG